jgi:hypothetical protein
MYKSTIYDDKLRKVYNFFGHDVESMVTRAMGLIRYFFQVAGDVDTSDSYRLIVSDIDSGNYIALGGAMSHQSHPGLSFDMPDCFEVDVTIIR